MNNYCNLEYEKLFNLVYTGSFIMLTETFSTAVQETKNILRNLNSQFYIMSVQ